MNRSEIKKGRPAKRGVDPLPFFYLLPAATVITYAVIRWGREMKNVIQVFIKLVVKA